VLVVVLFGATGIPVTDVMMIEQAITNSTGKADLSIFRLAMQAMVVSIAVAFVGLEAKC
jgi:type II secretory pathway component PulM